MRVQLAWMHKDDHVLAVPYGPLLVWHEFARRDSERWEVEA